MISKDGIKPTNSTVYLFDEFRFETEILLLQRDSQVVPLAPKALDVLFTLVEARGKLITKQEILEKVWADTFVEEANLTHHISALRKALGEDNNGRKFIETIPRRGYRFVAPIKEQKNGAAEIIISEKVSARAFEKVEIETDENGKLETAESPLLLRNARRSWKTYLKFLLPAAACILLLAVSFFAFRQWRQNNALRSFDTLRSVKLTSWKSTRSGEYWDFKSSHNGNMIAFSSSKDGNSGIYVRQIGGGEDLRITKDEWDNASPIWSPDDRQIMFTSKRENQNGIYSCASLGGASTLVKIIGGNELSLRGWSKDGAAIYYETEGNLFKLNLETKASAPLTTFASDKAVIRFFRISPDENKISYRELNGDTADLRILDIASGKTKSLTDGADMIDESAWSPDGAGIFYQIRRNKIYQIFFAYADGREPAQVTRGDANVELIDVSPDGTRLFYYNREDKSDIGGVNIETGEQLEIESESDSEFWAQVSPDGVSLAYLSNPHQNALQRLTDSSIVVRRVGDKSNPKIFKGLNQKWLPDNRRIGFLRFDDAAQIYNLWTFDTTSGAETQITTAGISPPAMAAFPYNRAEIYNFSWSPDSRKVVYSGVKRQNIFLKIDDGESVNVTNSENPKLTFNSPIWSPDGAKFVYISGQKPSAPDEKRKSGVWIYENGAAREIFTTEQDLRFLGWSNSGEIILEAADGVMKAEPINIKILQVSPAGASRVTNIFEMISADSMTLSPDVESVVFTKESNGKDDLYLASINGGEVKKLTANADSRTFFGSPTWLPDGKIVYFDKQERINTISMLENLK